MRSYTSGIKRNYKDRLFKFIYGRDNEQSRRWLLSLYNALNDSNYTNTDELKMTTIENIIYITMKNDISFLIDGHMTLYEQQSSYNPNMPLRGLLYFAQLYQKEISDRRADIFGSSIVKIPTPRFVVFYNGLHAAPDISNLRLSDAFEIKDSSNEFEWTATMYNINAGHNESLQKKCISLYDYSRYISFIRENIKKMAMEDAVNDAVEKAIGENLLEGFFRQQKMEVLNMCLTEFNQEEYDRNRRLEGYEEGMHNKAIETASKMMKKGISTLS
ncbi:hypothetical protein [Treponema sp.]|uniref:hypothetical protein n=1 Tax=Treponema sp. TaxID=166 RepID=UPI00257A10E1|nr:hypothetical protein [Treponema sp.]MBE6354199.1 hypothetical protein [Treponema sp.]